MAPQIDLAVIMFKNLTINDRTYAVLRANVFLACGSMVLPILAVRPEGTRVFALVERKNPKHKRR